MLYWNLIYSNKYLFLKKLNILSLNINKAVTYAKFNIKKNKSKINKNKNTIAFMENYCL